MSIGICDLSIGKARKSGFALVLCVALGACSDEAGLAFASKQGSDAAKAAQTSPAIPKSTHITLARGTIKLMAPKGYCIDNTSVKNGVTGSFALLSTCSSLDGKGSGADAAVMSVIVSPRRGASEAMPTLKELALAVAPNKVLQQTQKGNLALIQVATGGNDVFGPADPVHWRGATVLDRRLVLLGLYAPEGSNLTTNEGATLLTSLARGLSATPGSLFGASVSQSETPTQSKAAPPATAPDTVEPDKKGPNGFIARLLNRS